MKVVVTEWLRSSKGKFHTLVFFICNVVYLIADANFIITITRALESGDVVKGLTSVAIICMIRSGAGIIESWSGKLATYDTYRAMHDNFTDQVIDADYEMFTHFSVSTVTTIAEFMSNVTNIGKSGIRMVVNVISIMITIGSMYLLAGSLIIPIIVIYLICALAAEKVYKVYGKKDKVIKNLRKARNQKMENLINGFAELRSFSMASRERESMHQKNAQLQALFYDRTKIHVAVISIVEFLDVGALLLVVGWSLYHISLGNITVAVAMSMVMFVNKIINPLMTILDWADELSNNLAMSKDFKALITWHNKCKRGTIVLDRFEREIVFKDVKFSYENSSTILDGINMVIKKGQHIGICGKTGDGKSTLLKLLNKFYDIDEGELTIDGVEISDVTAESYRRKVGSVHQENTIFPGTILENVKYGSPEATEYEIIEACKRAKLYDFITSLKDGFNTDVGPKGLKLSGGQKQRIALARLFLQDPEIIILDEATSALDNETEQFIQDAIAALHGKTIITVAHRLTTIQNCDWIYVLDGGKIIEDGTHQMLMEHGGAYAHMALLKS